MHKLCYMADGLWAFRNNHSQQCLSQLLLMLTLIQKSFASGGWFCLHCPLTQSPTPTFMNFPLLVVPCHNSHVLFNAHFHPITEESWGVSQEAFSWRIYPACRVWSGAGPCSAFASFPYIKSGLIGAGPYMHSTEFCPHLKDFSLACCLALQSCISSLDFLSPCIQSLFSFCWLPWLWNMCQLSRPVEKCPLPFLSVTHAQNQYHRKTSLLYVLGNMCSHWDISQLVCLCELLLAVVMWLMSRKR